MIKRKPKYRFDPGRLKDITEMIPFLDEGNGKPDKAYTDRERGWVVQVFEQRTPACNGTPWEGTIQVSIKHTCGKTIRQISQREYQVPILWDELQAIKEHLFPGRIALEVYPPKENLVDVASMRWLWVLPPGAVIPFNLQGERDTLTSESVQ